MDRDVLLSLSPLERKALPALLRGADAAAAAASASLTETELLRAAQWLANKGLARVEKRIAERISLDENGRLYAAQQLPERRFVAALDAGPRPQAALQRDAALSDDEFRASLGLLKARGAITIRKDNDLVVELSANGRALAAQEWPEERLLARLPLTKAALTADEAAALPRLAARKRLVRIEPVVTHTITLTPLGRAAAQAPSLPHAALEEITPELLRSGAWRTTPFRRYDVTTPAPRRIGGARHPYARFLAQTKRLLSRMGFAEMAGPLIELEFFNFDALFQPQNHPARTWTDTYRIKSPRTGALPDRRLVAAVKAAHEHGGRTGSTGWEYRWDPTIASQLTPVAHDTAVTPRYLARGVASPGKYFSIMRCFRPDVIDATHGVEFNQMGGFVIAPGLHFRHLLGLLRTVAAELSGATEFRFIPCYYPFTEPSVQLSAKVPGRGWMELCGAGMFRPEMLEALGVREPVIAWGFGIDRLAMIKLDLADIRDLFSPSLDRLRTAPLARL